MSSNRTFCGRPDDVGAPLPLRLRSQFIGTLLFQFLGGLARSAVGNGLALAVTGKPRSATLQCTSSSVRLPPHWMAAGSTPAVMCTFALRSLPSLPHWATCSVPGRQCLRGASQPSNRVFPRRLRPPALDLCHAVRCGTDRRCAAWRAHPRRPAPWGAQRAGLLPRPGRAARRPGLGLRSHSHLPPVRCLLLHRWVHADGWLPCVPACSTKFYGFGFRSLGFGRGLACS